jgi:aminomethyltransferase
VTPREQHLATRRAAGLFDFSFMGLHEFPDAASLQPFQSRNLADLKPNRIAYTLLLKDDGAVLIDATVWRLDDGRFWLFAGRRAPYGGRDRSGEYAILALQGPESGKILSKILGTEPVRDLRYFHFIETGAMVVGRIGFSGELGYELLVPEENKGTLRATLLQAGAAECSFEAANSLRIESGYVLFDREVDGRANPRELGLERLAPGRSFDVARKLVGVEIVEGRASGELPMARVTSQCDSPTLGKGIALAFAPANFRAGDFVRLDNDYLGREVPLPFYDRERRQPRAAPL